MGHYKRIILPLAGALAVSLFTLPTALGVFIPLYNGSRCLNVDGPVSHADDASAGLFAYGIVSNAHDTLVMHLVCDMDVSTLSNRGSRDISAVRVFVTDGNDNALVTVRLGSNSPTVESEWELCTTDDTGPTLGWYGSTTLTPSVDCLVDFSHFAYLVVELPDVDEGINQWSGVREYEVEFP